MHSFRSLGVVASVLVGCAPRAAVDVEVRSDEVVSRVDSVESKSFRSEIDDMVTVHDGRTGRAIATRTSEGTSPCDEPGQEPRREAALVAWPLD